MDYYEAREAEAWAEQDYARGERRTQFRNLMMRQHYNEVYDRLVAEGQAMKDAFTDTDMDSEATRCQRPAKQDRPLRFTNSMAEFVRRAQDDYDRVLAHCVWSAARYIELGWDVRLRYGHVFGEETVVLSKGGVDWPIYLIKRGPMPSGGWTTATPINHK